MWRWHFYAGLIVLPVLALMAVTGALYLYKPEIERAVYHDRIVVRPGGVLLPPSRLVAVVEKASGGAVSQMQRPAAADESWRLTVGGTVTSEAHTSEPQSIMHITYAARCLKIKNN